MDKFNNIKLFLYSNKKIISIVICSLLVISLSVGGYISYKNYNKNSNKLVLQNTIIEKKRRKSRRKRN